MKKDKNTLKKAKEFYKKAMDEYKRAKEKKDDILFRDAAEKGWNAVLQSTNYLIKKFTGRTHKTHRERREELLKIETKDGKIRKYKFYERFAARVYILHMNCFYDGIYTEDELNENLKKAKTYIKDVEKVVK
jgi:hypothetical protein